LYQQDLEDLLDLLDLEDLVHLHYKVDIPISPIALRFAIGVFPEGPNLFVDLVLP
jgi:hypothetical protein